MERETAMTWEFTMPRRVKAAPAPSHVPNSPAHALAGVLQRYIADHYTSIRDAAAAWEMNDSAIGKIINDPTRVPRPKTMKKLAAGMGMPLQRLYELCGLASPDGGEYDELIRQAIEGIDTDGVKILARLRPEQKAALIALARSLLGPE